MNLSKQEMQQGQREKWLGGMTIPLLRSVAATYAHALLGGLILSRSERSARGLVKTARANAAQSWNLKRSTLPAGSVAFARSDKVRFCQSPWHNF